MSAEDVLSNVLMLTYVRCRLWLEGVFICNLMRTGRWYKPSVDRVCQEHEVMLTSGEFGYAFGGTLIVVSQLRIP